MKLYWTYVGLGFLIYKVGVTCVIMCMSGPRNKVSANMIQIGMHIKQTLVARCLIFFHQ